MYFRHLAIARGSRAALFCSAAEVHRKCWRAIVKPLNEAPARWSALNIRTNSLSIDCPRTSNSIYRLIALIWRQLTGQVYCDGFSAARTNYYQVNDLTTVLSTQRVL